MGECHAGLLMTGSMCSRSGDPETRVELDGLAAVHGGSFYMS